MCVCGLIGGRRNIWANSTVVRDHQLGPPQGFAPPVGGHLRWAAQRGRRDRQAANQLKEVDEDRFARAATDHGGHKSSLVRWCAQLGARSELLLSLAQLSENFNLKVRQLTR